MSKKRLLYLGFFTILFLGFYLVVRKWLAHKHVICAIQPFSFNNQDGNTITEKDVDGKVYVAEFFFTHCPGICPEMNNNMRKIYEQFKTDTNFLILSHTCDPDRDSVAQLKHYSDSMKVDNRRWMFLTGRKDSLYSTARFSYTLDDPANNYKSIDDQFIHTQFWALVDKNGDVREIFDGLSTEEVNDLIKQIKKLLKE